MERRIIEAVSALAGFAAVLCMGSTMAYLTSYDQAENQIAVGRNETKIEEDFPTPAPIPLEENPEYQKTVWVTNQSGGQGGSVDCYVRVSLSYSNEDIGRAVVLRNLDTANWKYNGADGYYYYTKILAKGESTTPLFTGFAIEAAEVDTACRDSITDFRIQVYEESVQAGDFADYSSAWAYYANPIGPEGKVYV